MTYWDLHAPRAIVVPPALEAVRDVIVPSLKHCHLSSSPLGVGLYLSAADEQPLAPVPLMYVSPRAAADRDPVRSVHNPPGVRPGWYAIAVPNSPFEVRVTRVNRAIPGKISENQITSRLMVDGGNTNNFEAFHLEGELYDERVALGFVERYRTTVDGCLERKVRRFIFRKATATEGEEGNAKDWGSIALEAFVGVAVPREYVGLRGQYSYSGNEKVNEREVAKMGKSIGVTPNGYRSVQSRRTSIFRSINEREVPEATITIFLRESSWMRTRRLVDDFGQACTHDMYKALLQQDSGFVDWPMPDNGPLTGPPRGLSTKSAKTSPLVIDLEKIKDEKEDPAVVKLEAVDKPAVVDLT